MDLVFVNDSRLDCSVEIFNPLGKSDHGLILFSCKIFLETGVTKTIKNWNKMDFLQAENYLKDIDWRIGMEGRGCDDMWIFFVNHLKYVLDNFVPDKPIFDSARRLPFPTRKLLKLKLRAWKNFLREKSNANLQLYRTARRNSKKAVDLVMRERDKELSVKCKNNPKVFWSHINKNLKSKSGINGVLADGVVVSDPQKISELFSSHFKNIFTKENFDDFALPRFEPNKFLSSFKLPECQDVLKIIDNLRENRSPDPDGINVYFMKKFRKYLAEPMSFIFRKCLSDGKFPNAWKLAFVKPIFKAGAKNLVSNYRPISLNSVVGKVLERWIYPQLEKISLVKS